MRLTMQDKNELLKAALKATDLEALRRYVVSLVDAADTVEIGSGKADATVPVPPYVETGSGYAAVRTAPRPASHEWSPDHLSSNGSGR